MHVDNPIALQVVCINLAATEVIVKMSNVKCLFIVVMRLATPVQNVLRFFADLKWHPRREELCTHSKPEGKRNS